MESKVALRASMALVVGLMVGWGVTRLWSQPTTPPERKLTPGDISEESRITEAVGEIASAHAARLEELPTRESVNVMPAVPVEEKAPDTEWLSFPRRKVPHLPYVFLDKATRRMSSREMYRHKALNFADTYIPPAKRLLFEQGFEARKKGIQDSYRLLNQAVAEEANRLITLGRLRPVVFRDTDEAQKLKVEHEKLGRRFPRASLYEGGDGIFKFFSANGQIYGLTTEVAPALRPVRDYDAVLRIEMAQYVLDWFKGEELITPVSASNYEAIITKSQERMFQ